MRKGKIGLFGGTYNPIHRGHIKAAKTAGKSFQLDKILFIPSYIPPHKDKAGVAGAKHRWNMVKKAVAPYPLFIPSSIEIDVKGPSYSITTIGKIKKKYPEAVLFFILGMDAFLEIDTWKDYQDVLKSCHFIVISRPGYNYRDAYEILGGRYKDKMTYTEEKDTIEINKTESDKIFLFKMNSLNISSSEIREKLKQGQSIKGLVPKAVEKYIKENSLYS